MNKKIKCFECGRELGSITSDHLKNCCGLTLEEYKKKYPQAETISEYVKYKRSQNCKNLNTNTVSVFCSQCGQNPIERSPAIHWNYVCDICKTPQTYQGKIYLPDKDLVVCQVCYQAMEQITWMHTKIHNLTLSEYRNKFPKAWVTNKKIREDRRARSVGSKNPAKRKDVRKKMTQAQTFNSQSYINKYPWIFPEIEKIRDNLGFIEVLCKKCGKWFVPSNYQLHDRIRQLRFGNDGSYFYCSDECKGECPLYRLNPGIFLSSGGETSYTDNEYQIFKNEVLRRQKEKFGFNFCELCESQNKLHIHHEFPKKTHPHMSLDPDNGIVLCEDCHIKKIHREDCSTAKLAYKC